MSSDSGQAALDTPQDGRRRIADPRGSLAAAWRRAFTATVEDALRMFSGGRRPTLSLSTTATEAWGPTSARLPRPLGSKICAWKAFSGRPGVRRGWHFASCR